ncbi:twin-arginine translocation signal domain-containing protein [Halapricum desulfuricans]|uniref:Envelope protein N-terminal domain-containing protein n=1 Tax=Halapricum desulfuricans TaxID=2841257 RepID=A0A897ND42_9EURY|nr:twin-arginine translocation signal domain-containing protein [Halapricum desulfuricans]QSG08879.1 Uncharacterized protein HSR122_1486 [Halapricum desulfuricans]
MATNQNPTLSRRTLLKTGAGAVAGGTLATGLGTDRSLVGESEALLPALAVVGGAAATGWALREYEVIGSDDPPEGLTPETLKQQVYSTAKKRKSVNQSTFVDNQNILNYMPEAAFSEAKTAALEALNDQKTKDQVQAAGEQAANKHFVTVEKNLLKSWNESVNEFANARSTLVSHPDVGYKDLFTDAYHAFSSAYLDDVRDYYIIETGSPQSVTLPDGSSIDVQRMRFEFKAHSSDYPAKAERFYSPVGDEFNKLQAEYNQPGRGSDPYVPVAGIGGDSFHYLEHAKWNGLWTKLKDAESQILSDLSLWVDNVYDKVQAGEIDTSQLISGVDLANMTDDSVPQAVTDLASLNIPADLDNQATIELDDGTIMAGFLGFTDSTATSGLAPGDSLDPSAVSGDVYMAHDLAEWSTPWTDWDSNKGIDGGLLHLTADPTVVDGQPVDDPSVLIYTVKTTAGETAAFRASDVNKTTNDSGTTVWEIDLSSKLEVKITEVESITITLDTESRYATQRIQQPFTVTETQNGEPVEPGQSRTPQKDDNYITQEEWDQLFEQQKELIDKYEEAKAGGGGFSWPSGPSLPENIWLYAGGFVAGLGILNAITS